MHRSFPKCCSSPKGLELLKLKLRRTEIFFLKPHQCSTDDKTLNWSSPYIKVIWAYHICHNSKASWKSTMWPHWSQWCEPRYIFLQGCSTLSSATKIGDLNELLVNPHCTSLVPDEFWCRSAALHKMYFQHASLKSNFNQNIQYAAPIYMQNTPSWAIISHCKILLAVAK